MRVCTSRAAASPASAAVANSPMAPASTVTDAMTKGELNA
jgi:hypothetical protein